MAIWLAKKFDWHFYSIAEQTKLPKIIANENEIRKFIQEYSNSDINKESQSKSQEPADVFDGNIQTPDLLSEIEKAEDDGEF